MHLFQVNSTFGLLDFTEACTVEMQHFFIYLVTFGWWRHLQACLSKGGVNEHDGRSVGDVGGVGQNGRDGRSSELCRGAVRLLQEEQAVSKLSEGGLPD